MVATDITEVLALSIFIATITQTIIVLIVILVVVVPLISAVLT
jgi:hypothetical protein